MIIQNAVLYKPTNEIYVSTHVHDFVSLPGGDFIDGGKSYLRRSLRHRQDYEDLSLTQEDSFDTICDKMVWGTRGLDGNDPLVYKFMRELSDQHLLSLRDYFKVVGARILLIRIRVLEHLIKERKL